MCDFPCERAQGIVFFHQFKETVAAVVYNTRQAAQTNCSARPHCLAASDGDNTTNEQSEFFKNGQIKGWEPAGGRLVGSRPRGIYDRIQYINKSQHKVCICWIEKHGKHMNDS